VLSPIRFSPCLCNVAFHIPADITLAGELIKYGVYSNLLVWQRVKIPLIFVGFVACP
jgi:hypothetical protein